MSKDLIISVVVPLHNAQNKIEHFVKQTVLTLEQNFQNYELILVDDNSVDKTVELIRALLPRHRNIRLLILSRHYKNQVAMTAGLDHAIGDYVVLMNIDDPPSEIPRLVHRSQDGFDVVYVKKPVHREQSLVQRLASSIFYKYAPLLTNLEIRRDASDYRVLSRRMVNSISQFKEHNRYMRMLYAYVGHKVDGIVIEYTQEWQAAQENSFRDNVGMALDAIISFSNKPLRYLSITSVVISLLSLFGAVVTLVDKIFNDNVVPGWTSMMAVQLLMFCILFLFLSVISEYISRILVESKNRPLYFIREELGGTSFSIENIVDTD
jgi:dolichol-phosphate mannosyltransferase